MKKKLVILDKNAHWWVRENLDWATQDKKGNWWIIPSSEFPENKVKRMKIKKSKEKSLPVDTGFLLLVVLSAALGISIAINVVYYLLR